MPRTVACSSCGAKLSVPDNAAGQTFQCPKCSKPFRVPVLTPQPATPPIAKAQPSVPPLTPLPDAAATPRPAREKQTKACPFCGETVLAVAKKCKHCGESIDATSPPGGAAASHRMLLGWIIAGAMLLAFGTTVGLVIYLAVKSTDQAENKGVASDTSTERAEPSRLLGGRELNLQAPEPRQPLAASNEFSSDEKENRGAHEKRAKSQGRPHGTKEVDLPTDGSPHKLSKTLASLDRLTIAIAPIQKDEAPTPEVWDGHSASIRGVVYTDDGRFVVSVSGAIEKIGTKADNSIRIWDARRGKQLRKLDDFREALDGVSVSPGGRFAVFGHGGHYESGKWIDSIDHDVRLWDLQENKQFYFQKGEGEQEQLEARFRGLDSSVFSTAFSPDRKIVVGVANSGMVVVWEAQSGTSLIRGKVEAVARQRDDAGLLRRTSYTLTGIPCIRFTPDGRRLMTAGADYTVRLFDVTTGRQLHNFESHQDIVWAVATTRMRDGGLLGLSGGGSRQRVGESGFVPGRATTLFVCGIWTSTESFAASSVMRTM